MKKFVFVLGLCLAFGVNVRADDNSGKKEFVNPIFYQPLEPRSTHSGYVYITPTFIKFMTPLDKNLIDSQGQCELLENQESFIKLLCNTSWQMLENGRMVTNTSKDIYTYEIKGMVFGNCLDIEEVIYEITKRGNEKLSTSHYCVTPPDYTPSEFD